MKTKTKKQTKNTNNQEFSKKLSKVGEWFRSGESALTIVDMRAVLR